MNSINNIKNNKKNFRLSQILKIIATSTLVFFILKKVGIERIIQTWNDLKHFEVTLAIFIAPAVIFLGTYKWRLIVNGDSIIVGWRQALISFLGGMGVGLLTPMRIGELSRIFFLPGKREALAGIALVDKLVDLESLLILATIGCSLAFGIIYTISFALLTIILLSFIFFPALYTSIVLGVVQHTQLKHRLELMHSTINSLLVKITISCLVIRLLICSIDMIQFGLLIHAFDSVKPIAIIAVYPIIVLINTFPITIGGIGIREGTAALLLNFFGVSTAAAVTASFLLFCINTLIPGIIGAFFLGQAKR